MIWPQWTRIRNCTISEEARRWGFGWVDKAVDSDRCRNPVRARTSAGFLMTASIYSLWRFIFIIISFFLLSAGIKSKFLFLFFHFVVRQGIEGTMLCRILKTRMKHRYFTRGKSFESGTSLTASCAHELRYQTAKSCAFFLERRKFEERTRWKRRVSKTLVLCRGRFRSGSVPNPQNQSDLQSKVSNRFWTPCAKCTACAKCSELGVQIRGWCTFSRLRLTGEFCLRIRRRWRSMVRCTFSRVLIFAGTPAAAGAASRSFFFFFLRGFRNPGNLCEIRPWWSLLNKLRSRSNWL